MTAFDGLAAAYVGNKVPVEDLGGYGTADAHWRESVFDNELMTGYINYGPNPLSVVTIASLADLGYSVDMNQADPYSIFLAAPRVTPTKALQMVHDIRQGPIGILGRKGQPVRVYRK